MSLQKQDRSKGESIYFRLENSVKKDSKGQATLELALVLPAIVLLLVFVLHIAIIVRQHMFVAHVTREAARELSVNNNKTKAVELIKNDLPNADVKINRPITSGEYLSVEVSDSINSPLPIIGKAFPSVEVSSEFKMRVEK